MGKLINTNNKHHATDFHKGFIQGIISASTICHSDELTLPNRYITALKALSSNHQIILSSSDKCGSVVIMDSMVYNQKLMDLLGDSNTDEQISLQIFSNNMTLTNPTEN